MDGGGSAAGINTCDALCRSMGHTAILTSWTATSSPGFSGYGPNTAAAAAIAPTCSYKTVGGDPGNWNCIPESTQPGRSTSICAITGSSSMSHCDCQGTVARSADAIFAQPTEETCRILLANELSAPPPPPSPPNSTVVNSVVSFSMRAAGDIADFNATAMAVSLSDAVGLNDPSAVLIHATAASMDVDVSFRTANVSLGAQIFHRVNDFDTSDLTARLGMSVLNLVRPTLTLEELQSDRVVASTNTTVSFEATNPSPNAPPQHVALSHETPPQETPPQLSLPIATTPQIAHTLSDDDSVNEELPAAHEEVAPTGIAIASSITTVTEGRQSVTGAVVWAIVIGMTSLACGLICTYRCLRQRHIEPTSPAFGEAQPPKSPAQLKSGMSTGVARLSPGSGSAEKRFQTAPVGASAGVSYELNFEPELRPPVVLQSSAGGTDRTGMDSAPSDGQVPDGALTREEFRRKMSRQMSAAPANKPESPRKPAHATSSPESSPEGAPTGALSTSTAPPGIGGSLLSFLNDPSFAAAAPGFDTSVSHSVLLTRAQLAGSTRCESAPSSSTRDEAPRVKPSSSASQMRPRSTHALGVESLATPDSEETPLASFLAAPTPAKATAIAPTLGGKLPPLRNQPPERHDHGNDAPVLPPPSQASDKRPT